MKSFEALEQPILSATSAESVIAVQSLQQLWGGYGDILKVTLHGSEYDSVIVKAVKFPQPADHPRGWQSDFAHQRKLSSYQVETQWYQHYVQDLPQQCRTPAFIWQQSNDQQLLLIMEDLTPNYPVCLSQVNLTQVKTVLTWLAAFHAACLNKTGEGLWPVGSYWHLQTRPDEWAVMQDEVLKENAHKIDEALNNATYKTLIHGDAKLANFCFSEQGGQVAAVDFQYVGVGCGMKDVAYFFSSCLSSQQCMDLENSLLSFYFAELKQALGDKLTEQEKFKLELEWRQLYCFAWADFERFLNGWSPEHWKRTAYAKKQTHQALSFILDRRR